MDIPQIIVNIDYLPPLTEVAELDDFDAENFVILLLLLSLDRSLRVVCPSSSLSTATRVTHHVFTFTHTLLLHTKMTNMKKPRRRLRTSIPLKK